MFGRYWGYNSEDKIVNVFLVVMTVFHLTLLLLLLLKILL